MPGLSNFESQHTILIFGDVLPHRKLFSKSLSVASAITLIRCSEAQDGTLSIWKRLNPSLVVARQAFIEQLPINDFLQLADYGKLTYVLAILDQDTPEAATKLLRLGCRGVLPCRFSPKLFRRAALKVLEGEIWAQGRVVANLVSDLLRRNSAKESALTPREER